MGGYVGQNHKLMGQTHFVHNSPSKNLRCPRTQILEAKLEFYMLLNFLLFVGQTFISPFFPFNEVSLRNNFSFKLTRFGQMNTLNLSTHLREDESIIVHLI